MQIEGLKKSLGCKKELVSILGKNQDEEIRRLRQTQVNLCNEDELFQDRISILETEKEELT